MESLYEQLHIMYIEGSWCLDLPEMVYQQIHSSHQGDSIQEHGQAACGIYKLCLGPIAE